MHELRLDVVQHALVVGDHQHPHLRGQGGVDALGHVAQRVDVQARIGLVQDRHLRPDDGHLQHLQPLLLAAGESVVDVAGGEGRVHVQQRHLLLQQLAELGQRNAGVLGTPPPGLVRLGLGWCTAL